MDEPEFVPIDPDGAMTPADVDRYLRLIYNELYFARKRLREARYKEIQDLKAYSEAKIPLLADPDCPDPERAGVTKAARDEWINARIPALWWAYQGSKVVRQTAEDYSKQLREQVSCLQSINSIAKQAFDLTGRNG